MHYHEYTTLDFYVTQQRLVVQRMLAEEFKLFKPHFHKNVVVAMEGVINIQRAFSTVWHVATLYIHMDDSEKVEWQDSLLNAYAAFIEALRDNGRFAPCSSIEHYLTPIVRCVFQEDGTSVDVVDDECIAQWVCEHADDGLLLVHQEWRRLKKSISFWHKIWPGVRRELAAMDEITRLWEHHVEMLRALDSGNIPQALIFIERCLTGSYQKASYSVSANIHVASIKKLLSPASEVYLE